MSAFLYVLCTTCVRCQKRALGSLDWKLQEVTHHVWTVGTDLRFVARVATAPNCRGVSPAPELSEVPLCALEALRLPGVAWFLAYVPWVLSTSTGPEVTAVSLTCSTMPDCGSCMDEANE